MRRNYSILNDTALLHDPRLAYLRSSSSGWWISMVNSSGKIPGSEWDWRKSTVRNEMKLVGKFNLLGVGILAGTDNGNPFCFPGFSLHEELGMLTKAGLTPSRALQTATTNPARFLNRNDKIKEGSPANLVLLDEDPRIDIANTKKIYAVIARGRAYERRQLDRMLEEVKAMANKP